MNFILGCNYWASHAGVNMWSDWKEDVVDNDLKVLSENGIEYLRVFPLWQDFQPVIPLYNSRVLFEYRMANEQHPNNPYFLDETMMDRFERFTNIAEKYNMNLVVGLITGWMSGRLFVPPALYGKNPIKDTTAIMFEQKFIKGFVQRFRDNNAIYAWDLGNECNCMDETCTTEEAYAWSSMITSAIKAQDNTRMVISGMHSLECQNGWRIQDQGEITDMLTTHPYPLWVPHCTKDRINSTRTLLHATAETEYYSSISKKPCLVEEIGTMGPMICSEEVAGDFMRVNLFSNWANGAPGLMWWCANQQSHLEAPPYDWNMCERELGMLYEDLTPKPQLLELNKFSKFLKESKLELSKLKKDAVCIITKGQDNWGIAYMTYVLAKQAGLNITFTYIDDKLPDSDCYLLPSINGDLIMSRERYFELKEKVASGATLYISLSDAIITEFEELTSARVITTELSDTEHVVNIGGKDITFSQTKRYNLSCDASNVIAYDETSNPCFTSNNYGDGKVYMLNFPLEEMLLDVSNMADGGYSEIYKIVGKEIIDNKKIISENKYIGVTEHEHNDKLYIVAINYSDTDQIPNFKLKPEYKITKVIYGDLEHIKACDALVFRLEKK